MNLFVLGYKNDLTDINIDKQWEFTRHIAQNIHNGNYLLASKIYHDKIETVHSPQQIIVSSLMLIEIDPIIGKADVEGLFSKIDHFWPKLSKHEQHKLLSLRTEMILDYYLIIRNHDSFRSEFQLLRNEFEASASKDILQELTMNYYLAKNDEINGKLSQAHKYYKKAQKLASNEIWNVKIESSLGVLMAKLGDRRKASKMFAKLLEKTSSKKLQYHRASIFNNLTIISNLQGNPVQAEQFADYGLKLCNSQHFVSLKFKLINNKANIFFSKGQFNDALTMYQLLLDYYEKEGRTREYLRLLNSIGAARVRVGEYKLGLDCFEKAYTNYNNLEAVESLNLSLNYVDLTILVGDYERSFRILNEIKSRIDESKSQSIMARYVFQQLKLSVYCESTERLNEKEIKSIEEYYIFESDHQGLASIKYYQAQIKELYGDYYSAYELIQESIKHADYSDHPIMTAQYLFYQLYLLLMTNECDVTSRIVKKMKSLATTYNYKILHNYYITAEFLVKVRKMADEKWWIGMGDELEGLFQSFTKDQVMNSKFQEHFLLFLLDIVCTSGFPKELDKYYNQSMDRIQLITSTTKSIYMQVCIQLIQAKYAIYQENYKEAELYLDYAHDLAINHGYGRKIEEITIEKMRIQQLIV